MNQKPVMNDNDNDNVTKHCFLSFCHPLLIYSIQRPVMKKMLDAYSNQKYNYKRQKGSKFHPARSCRDIQLDSKVSVESGE